MPIWAIILLTFFCAYIGSTVGWLAAFGIFFSRREFWSYIKQERETQKKERSDEKDENETK